MCCCLSLPRFRLGCLYFVSVWKDGGSSIKPVRFGPSFLVLTLPPFQCYCRGPSTVHNKMPTPQRVYHLNKAPIRHSGMQNLHHGYCCLSWYNSSSDKCSKERRSILQVGVSHLKLANTYLQVHCIELGYKYFRPPSICVTACIGVNRASTFQLLDFKFNTFPNNKTTTTIPLRICAS